MLEIQKEKISINKLISEKKEIIMIEGDMIVPDSKPDILNTICTSGVVSIYKKEVQDERIRIDGAINTYIMYMPDGTEDTVRGLNTSVDFSENINVDNCKEGMDLILNTKIKSIEAKVINGRKIGIKVALEIELKIYLDEDVEVINEVENSNTLQMLKENLMINSLVGKGRTKIFVKDNIQLDNSDNFGEILESQVYIVDKDIKTSYNKVLVKAEAEIELIYLTEDNKINNINYRIPIVGFIDIPNVSEENICDINYEIKNIIIKPNSQEEHSIYIEIETETICYAYEEKEINLLQDLYSTIFNIEFEQKNVVAITDKKNTKDLQQIREQINFRDIDGLKLINVDISPQIINENKINTKILYETELNLKFIFKNSRAQIVIKEAQIPFQYTVENLQNGESINTRSNIEIKSKNFVLKDGGIINCNLDIVTDTDMYRTSTINVIDSIQENEKRNIQDYSIIIYIVKKGDTLWNIAKELGSTVDGIAKINKIENKNLINPGQKLYIPKFEEVLN